MYTCIYIYIYIYIYIDTDPEVWGAAALSSVAVVTQQQRLAEACLSEFHSFVSFFFCLVIVVIFVVFFCSFIYI